MEIQKVYYSNKSKYWDPLVDPESENSIFITYKDLFLLSACLGYKEKDIINYEETPYIDKGEINISVFNKIEDIPIVNSLVLAITEDITYLSDDPIFTEKKFKIVEKLANHGVKILYNEIINKPGDPIINLINRIIKEYNKKEKESILKTIEEEI